ncbi:hypothetical protein JHK82_013057 [Glycine max]|uniref:Uncharacterized protein n=2 Tax=Glycine subgen. Soja TaxID=1462606 RepID=A0A0R0K2B0_SOYBN|nr:hypothetical protein JHK87_012977 [Glycine soja]KAG5040947.1 hypothetical protein JHK85_013423 [Glycine max]KAG5058087.1 hypothetical protein JHK86_013083 [Glycine max]KAG5155088.1 hypothetical protein JHK82_013057 [Glycine max]KAH1134583.1 hypothetical protein GYH30_012768 [Glycine max]
MIEPLNGFIPCKSNATLDYVVFLFQLHQLPMASLIESLDGFTPFSCKSNVIEQLEYNAIRLLLIED